MIVPSGQVVAGDECAREPDSADHADEQAAGGIDDDPSSQLALTRLSKSDHR